MDIIKQMVVLNYEYIQQDKIINTKKKFSKKDLQTILNYKDLLKIKFKKSNLLKRLELEQL